MSVFGFSFFFLKLLLGILKKEAFVYPRLKRAVITDHYFNY